MKLTLKTDVPLDAELTLTLTLTTDEWLAVVTDLTRTEIRSGHGKLFVDELCRAHTALAKRRDVIYSSDVGLGRL
jgi:hypothetical protein